MKASTVLMFSLIVVVSAAVGGFVTSRVHEARLALGAKGDWVLVHVIGRWCGRYYATEHNIPASLPELQAYVSAKDIGKPLTVSETSKLVYEKLSDHSVLVLDLSPTSNPIGAIYDFDSGTLIEYERRAGKNRRYLFRISRATDSGL